MIFISFFFRKFLFLLMTCFILNSCGYELRSVTELSNFNFDFKADETDLNLQLKDRLKEKKNFSNASQDVPQIKITILNHSIERFVGSIGRAARTTQVRLDYKLSYQLEINDEPPRIEIFEDSSYIDFNQADLLSFEDEIGLMTRVFINKALRNLEFKIFRSLNEAK
tara:strand:+ start:155 stop:655 length:501 start_codon:yes stop_codon:yes gene_type:complete